MMSRDEVYVVGASGHGKVIAAAIRELGITVAGFVEDAKPVGAEFFGSHVVCSLADIGSVKRWPMIIAIGDNVTRQRVTIEFALRLSAPHWMIVTHPQAHIGRSCVLQDGTFVGMGACITEDVMIGEHCIINTNASVDHDCTLGNFSHVACGATLAGNVRVGDGALIGVGATVLPGRRIGNWAVIGAGATVTRDVPDGVTVAGVPAKQIGGIV